MDGEEDTGYWRFLAVLALVAMAVVVVPLAALLAYLFPERPDPSLSHDDPCYGAPGREAGLPDCRRCGRRAREHLTTRRDWTLGLRARCPVQGRFGTRRYDGPGLG